MSDLLQENLLALSASAHFFVEHWPLFATLLIAQAGLGGLAGYTMQELPLDRTARLGLAFLAGWAGLGLLFGLLAWFSLLGNVWLPALAWLVCGLFLLAARRWLFFWERETSLLVVVCALLLLHHLAPVSELLVPPYADSVEHTLIVQDLLSPGQAARAHYQVGAGLERYYHFGFHALAAGLAAVWKTSPGTVILLLGQYTQVIIALGAFLFARVAIGSRTAAWAALLFVGLLLPLPSHAANWGKYPALASLPVLMGGLALLLAAHRNPPALRQPGLVTLLLVFGLAAGLFHSRSLVLAGFASLVASLIPPLAPRLDLSREEDFLTTLLGCFAIAVLLASFPLSQPDIHLGLYGLLWVLALMALFYRPSFVLHTGFFGLFCLFSLLITLPPGWLPERFSFLLDGPFTQIILSCLAGLWAAVGLAALGSFLKARLPGRVIAWGQALALVAVLGSVLLFGNHRPDPCCIYLDDDDLFAMAWMREHLLPDTRVGIAATGQPGNFLPADGGAWLEPLLGLPTTRLPYDTNFFLSHPGLCAWGIAFIYVDGLENSFDAYTLTGPSATHRFGAGSVQIYELKCHLPGESGD